MNFDTVVFAIKRRCRRLTVTVAGPGLVSDCPGQATVPQRYLPYLFIGVYAQATVPQRYRYGQVPYICGNVDFNEEVPQRLRSIFSFVFFKFSLQTQSPELMDHNYHGPIFVTTYLSILHQELLIITTNKSGCQIYNEFERKF